MESVQHRSDSGCNPVPFHFQFPFSLLTLKLINEFTLYYVRVDKRNQSRRLKVSVFYR